MAYSIAVTSYLCYLIMFPKFTEPSNSSVTAHWGAERETATLLSHWQTLSEANSFLESLRT